jgi:hypothetical protein
MADWFPDWEARAEHLKLHGLPCTILGLAWSDELLVLQFDIEEHFLPRSHVARGFELHLSLLFASEFTEDLHHHALSLHRRWAGVRTRLPVQWVGSGGAAMLDPNGSLASDPDLTALHAAGYFSNRQVHISL